MKNHALFLLTALLAWSVNATAESQQPVARIVTELQSSFDACKTVDMRLLEYIFRQRLGYPYQCESMPWLRAQRLVNLGERDGMIAIPTDERASFADFSVLPLMQVKMRLYVAKNSSKYSHFVQAKSVDDLRQDIFVAQRGSGWASEHIASRNIKIEWTKSVDSVFAMIAKGHGDFTVLPEVYANPIIRAQQLNEQIVMMPSEFGTSEYRFMMSKRSPILFILKKFDAELIRMHNDGSLKSMEQLFLQERQ